MVPLLGAVIVASCGSPSSTTTTTPPGGSASAHASTCHLPVWLFDWSATGDQGMGFFLDTTTGALVPTKPPVRSPRGEMTYLATAERWLPVPRVLVGPDGKYYAYNEGSGNPEVDRVHVVDVATGIDRVIAQGSSGTAYEAVDFEADGVYAGRSSQGPGTSPGLWRLDPQTGTATLVDAAQHWSWIRGGYAYTVVPNPTDPVVVQGGPQSDTLLRLELRSHKVEQWLHRRGVFLNLRGFDWTGRPLLLLGDSLADLVVVAGQNDVQPIPGGSRDVTVSYVSASLVAVPDGFWLGVDQGVVRYAAKGGFQLIWKNPTTKTVLPLVAGPCA